MEDQVKLTCGSCGSEVLRPAKEPPKNGREARQALFHCEYCGAVNLRDGTVRTKKDFVPEEDPEVEKEGSGGSLIGWIIGAVIAVAGAIFLGKVIKKGQGNTGGNPGSSTGGNKQPWHTLP